MIVHLFVVVLFVSLTVLVVMLLRLLLLLPASVLLLVVLVLLLLLLLPLPLLLLPLPLLFVCFSFAGGNLGCLIKRGKIVVTLGIPAGVVLMVMFVSLTVLVVLVVMLDRCWVGGTCLGRRGAIVIHSEGGVWFVIWFVSMVLLQDTWDNNIL